MIRSKFFSRFIVVTLTAALLLISGSRAIRVSALADPVQAIAPVYDTQIIQLKNYIDNGGMTASQLDIFYTLAGFYVLGQAGNTGTKLRDPYANSSSVKDWLISCGIELYNTVIGLVPDTIQLPNGSFMNTAKTKEATTFLVATLMGAAVKAATYPDYNTFMQEVESSGSYYLPWSRSTQYGLNQVFGTKGGVYDWQFDESPWTSSFQWSEYNLTEPTMDQYNTLIENEGGVPIRTNYTNYPNYRNLSILFPDKYNLFLNTSTGKASITYDNGTNITNTYNWITGVRASSATSVGTSTYQYVFAYPRDISNFDGNTYLEIVRNIFNSYNNFNNALIYMNVSNQNSPMNLVDIIDHVYVGSSWIDKNELQNLTDLNFTDSDQEYYTSVSDDNDYLLDIKGILTDILNNTDLYNIFIDNIYSPDGVLVHDTDLIQISVKLLDYYFEQNPPIPVNLNDIAEYTDNTYLDMVKERATAAGSTLANLVAFWHNCDFELVYVLFGAGITVLIGAFIGKWGHS